MTIVRHQVYILYRAAFSTQRSDLLNKSVLRAIETNVRDVFFVVLPRPGTGQIA